MTEPAKLPNIRIIKALCFEMPAGHCWHAAPPYYSGHHSTKEKAALAAVRRKRELEKKAPSR